MFIYTDFKMYVTGSKFDDARSMLSNTELDTGAFSILANAAMFLSLIFRYPEDDVYDTLKDNWDNFKEFFSEYVQDVPSLYDQTEMQSDFIKLFKQDFKGHKVVPYISFYTEENKMLYGKSTFNIRAWMAEEGYVLDKASCELEDNIYVVLEFLSAMFARLAEPKNIEQWYGTLKNIYNVLDNYGVVITDEFAEITSKRADMPFYAVCAQLLQAFIRDLDAIMEDVLTSA